MRRLATAWCVLLLVCGCEYNYYVAVGDGGVNDMPGYTDDLGEYHETEPNQGIFRYDSKLQGNATLALAPAPALVPVPGFPIPRLPLIKESLPTMAMGQTLIDLATRDNQPHVVTLSFGKLTTPALSLAAGPFAEVVAVLNVGVGGVAYYAEVDVVEGLQFSIAANRLQVHVVYRVPYGGGAVPSPAPTVDVGVSAASGVIAHGRQPQRTIIQGGTAGVPAVAAGPATAAVAFIIPPFAKTVKAVAFPANAQYDFALFTVTGINTIALYPIVAPATQEYPIPSEAYWANVINQGPVAIVDYSMVFELAL